MKKINFTEFGARDIAKNGKEYFEVIAGSVSLDDVFIVPAREAGVYGKGRLKKFYEASPERIWATVEGLGKVYNVEGAQLQRVYINRIKDND